MSKNWRINSFDIVRFAAATMVILSHSYALVGQKEPSLGIKSLGTLSVWVFFILSGYLIALSWKQYPRFNVFMIKRILRIFPALIVAILLTILVLGSFSSLSYRDYILNQETLTYLNNLLLFNTVHSLPGVFANNLYPSGVNGSLWTLAYEITMYLSVAVLGALSLLKRRLIKPLWLLLLVYSVAFMRDPDNLSIYLFYLNLGLLAQLGLMFYSGVLLQAYENKIVYKPSYMALALIVFIVGSHFITSLTPLFAGVFLAYALIGLCKAPWFSGFGKYGDFSYGLYIYAFPVQQSLVHLLKIDSPVNLFALSFVVTLVLAVLSWHIVEKKFIHLKKRIRHEDYPISERHEELAHAW